MSCDSGWAWSCTGCRCWGRVVDVQEEWLHFLFYAGGYNDNVALCLILNTKLCFTLVAMWAVTVFMYGAQKPMQQLNTSMTCKKIKFSVPPARQNLMDFFSWNISSWHILSAYTEEVVIPHWMTNMWLYFLVKWDTTQLSFAVSSVKYYLNNEVVTWIHNIFFLDLCATF